SLVSREAPDGGLTLGKLAAVERQELEAEATLAGETGASVGQETASQGPPPAVQSQAGGDEDEIASRLHDRSGPGQAPPPSVYIAGYTEGWARLRAKSSGART